MKNIFYLLILSFFFVACTKENSDSFSPYPGTLNDTAWQPQLSATAPVNKLFESLTTPPLIDSFLVSTGATIRLTEFLSASFQPNTFALPNGASFTGQARVEVVHLRKKGDMIRFSKPTTSFGRLLKTAGAFFIRVSKDGQELVLAPNKQVKLKFNDASPVNDMRAFYGIENIASQAPIGANHAFTWTLAPDSSRVTPYVQVDSLTGITTKGYELITHKLRWIGASFFADTSSSTQTRIDVLLPLNFTNTNTAVFAVFNNEKTVVQLIPDITSRTFFALNIPTGKSITLVSLSKMGDAISMGTKTFMTTPNRVESLSPELRTKAQVNLFLDNL